jgi:hypothetical protein
MYRQTVLTRQMFTDFVNECQKGQYEGSASSMIAAEVKIGGGGAKAVNAEVSV